MDANYYKSYYQLERSHWWFRARLHILESFVKKEFPNTAEKPLKILNAGVATGATTEMLSQFGEVVSVEYDKACCDFLKEKTGIDALNESLTELPMDDNEYDLVCAFDVVEHIEDDAKAVSEMRRVLKPGGACFTTVPAFMFMWGRHDVVNHHFRRYTYKNYNRLLTAGHLKKKYSSYFNFWLFLPVATIRVILRLISGKSETVPKNDTEVLHNASFVNTILYRLFKSENVFVKNRIRLPFGVSIMAWYTKE